MVRTYGDLTLKRVLRAKSAVKKAVMFKVAKRRVPVVQQGEAKEKVATAFRKKQLLLKLVLAKAGPEGLKAKVRVFGRKDGSHIGDVTVSFGSVIIEGLSDVASEDVRRNVAIGNSALVRARKAFIEPGVKLSLDDSVAKYHADPDHPGILIRELNGRRERVAFSNGKFELAQ
jgi:hypothetical protein